MNKKQLNLGILSLVFIVLLMGGSAPLAAQAAPTGETSQIKTDQNLNTIVYAMPYDFAEFSVFTADSYATAQWVSAVYSGLLKRDGSQNNKYVPDLASDYEITETDDGKLDITVDLQPNLKFATGGDLDAEDVAFSYHVALTPAINTNTYGFLSTYIVSNDSVSVVDSDTVSITVNSTYAFAEGLLTQSIIEKAEFEEDYNNCLDGIIDACSWNRDSGADARGAGPFYVHDIDTTNAVVTLRKNKHYYNASNVMAEQLIFQQIATPEGAISALASGDIDIMDAQYVPAINAFQGISGVENVIVGDPSHQEISLNHLNGFYGNGTFIQDGDTADNDRDALNIRKAMSHIANRETFANQILQGLGSPAATLMPTVSTGWDETLDARTYDISMARQYMASAFSDLSDEFNESATPMLTNDTSILTEAGVDEKCGTYDPNTDSIPHPCLFEMTVLSPNTNPARNQWSSAWAQELPKIGIKVKDHVSTTWGNIIPRTFGHTDAQPLGYDDGGYDVLFVGYSWGLDWDPSGLLTESGLCGSGSCDNFYNYVNATVEQMISDYTNELDEQARIDYAQDLQQAMFDDIPVIPLVYPQSHWGFSDELVGYGDAVLISISSQEWDEISLSSWSDTVPAGGELDARPALEYSGDTTDDTDEGGVPVNSGALLTGIFMSAFVAVYIRRRKL